MTQKERLETILNDLSEAKGYASEIHTSILEWRKDCSGDYKDLQKAGKDKKAQIVSKDITRAIESAIPSLCEPFLSDDDIVKVEVNSPVNPADIAATEYIINQQFRAIDRLTFFEKLGKTLMEDGTVVLKTTLGSDLEPRVDIVNPFEVMIDPTARSKEEINFVIQRRVVSIDDILSNPEWFGKHTLEDLEVISRKTSSEYDDAQENGLGHNTSVNFQDRLRQLVEVFEYNGVLENDEGELEPRLVIFVPDANMVLNDCESPYPAKWRGIPFDFIDYISVNNRIFGASIAVVMADYQKSRTGFLRAIHDNANMASHAQLWVKKGALDVVNKRKMLNGQNFETNTEPNTAIVQGQFNPIPPSVFQIMEQMKVEEEEISGITRMGQGVGENALKSGVTATAVATANETSARRLTFIVRKISNQIARVLSKFIDLNAIYLQPRQVGEFLIDNTMMVDSGSITLHAPSDFEKNRNIQNSLFMLQNLQSLGELVPPQVYFDLLTEISSELGMYSLSGQLKQAKEQAVQTQAMMQNQAQQAQQVSQQVQQQVDLAKASKDMAEAQKKEVEAQLMAYGLK
jgi:hypothetical protein